VNLTEENEGGGGFHFVHACVRACVCACMSLSVCVSHA
jgi:hypothetical protein